MQAWLWLFQGTDGTCGILWINIRITHTLCCVREKKHWKTKYYVQMCCSRFAFFMRIKIIFLTSDLFKTWSALYDCPHIIVVKNIVSIRKVVFISRQCSLWHTIYWMLMSFFYWYYRLAWESSRDVENSCIVSHSTGNWAPPKSIVR